MEQHQHHFFPFLVIMLCLVVVLASFLVFQPRITGRLVAVGGQMSSLHIESTVIATSWLGMYGNLTTNFSNTSFYLGGGQVLPLLLTYDTNFTNETVIVASFNEITDWSNITAATHAQINLFLGVSSDNPQSSENTLEEIATITLNNVAYESLAVTTLSVSGTYRTHALFVNNSLVFVTKPVNGVGFDGSPTDFELLIPLSSAMNVSFVVFEQSNLPFSGPLSCADAINLSAILANDNSSVRLSWEAASGATGYELLYVNGPLNGQLDFSAPTVVAMGNSRVWTDSNPSSERYYKVRVLSDNNSCEVNEYVGTLALDLSPDYNLISTPLLAHNKSVEETLRSINGSYDTIFEFDNNNKIYELYTIRNGFTFKTFDTIKPGKGYWIKVNESGVLRFTGAVVFNHTTNLTPDYNLLGFMSIRNGNYSVEETLVSIAGSYDTIFEFDNNNKIYELYTIRNGFTFKTFDTIKPGKGYWIKVNESKIMSNSGAS